MSIKIPKQLNKTTILLAMMFLYSGIGNYFWRVLSIVIPISFSTFTTIVWVVVVLWTFPLFLKKLQAKHLIMYFFAVLFFFVQWKFSDQSIFTFERLGTLVFSTLLAFFVGVSIEADETLFDSLYKMSTVVLFVSVAYSFYYMSDRVLLTDNMGYAYNVLPSILIIVSGIYHQKKRKSSILLSVIAFMFLLGLGTRGPILCLVIFVILLLLKYVGFTRFSVLAVAFGLVFSVFLNSSLYATTMNKFSTTLGDMGFSTRIIEMLLEESLSDGNGRDAIQDALLNEIKDDPLKFRGAFSDRASTKGLVDDDNYISYKNGTYAHNLFLEIIHNYGIVLGGLFLILLLFLIIRLFVRCKKEVVYIVAIAICIGFVQLLVSGTYLTQPIFFMMIGLCMNGTITKKSTTGRVCDDI